MHDYDNLTNSPLFKVGMGNPMQRRMFLDYSNPRSFLSIDLDRWDGGTTKWQ